MLTLLVNDQKRQIPTMLSEVSLEKFIAYYQQHGHDLNKKLEKRYQETAAAFQHAAAEDIEMQQEFVFDEHLTEEALAWFCFWTGFDIDEARTFSGIAPVIDHYRLFRESILAKAEFLTDHIENRFVINGEEWNLQDYRQSGNPEEMTSKEIILAKFIMNLVDELKEGNWTQLPKLLAIYLRKNGEAFTHDLFFDGERMETLKSLPMDTVVRCCHLLKQATDQIGLPSNEFFQTFSLN